MRKISKHNKKLKEDFKFARRTEKAWKEIEEGNCETITAKEFLKEKISRKNV